VVEPLTTGISKGPLNYPQEWVTGVDQYYAEIHTLHGLGELQLALRRVRIMVLDRYSHPRFGRFFMSKMVEVVIDSVRVSLTNQQRIPFGLGLTRPNPSPSHCRKSKSLDRKRTTF
jgi:hypothetical protein